MARTRQPQGTVDISSVWRSRVICAWAGSRFDQAAGTPLALVGSGAAITPTNRGLALKAAGTSYWLSSALSKVSFGTGDFSVIVGATPQFTGSSVRVALGCYSASNGNFWLGQGGQYWSFSVAGAEISANNTNGDFINNGGYPRLVIGSRINGQAYLYVDGVAYNPVAASGSISPASGIGIGDFGSLGGFLFNDPIWLASVLSGGISTQEAKDLYSNPWQIFAPPRRLWIQLGVAASGDTSLIIPDISQTQSLDSLLLTTQSAIVIQDTAQTHALENIVLSTAASTNLIVNDTSQTHTVDAPLLTSASLLGLADTSQSHTLDNTILTSNTGVVVADTSQGHTTENLALDSGLILTVNDVNQSHTVDAQTMVTTSILQIADVAHGQQTDSIDLNAQWFITVNDSNHSHTVEVPTLTLPGTGTGATVDEIADEIMLRLNATTIPVDVQKINSVEVFGTGTNIDPWR